MDAEKSLHESKRWLYCSGINQTEIRQTYLISDRENILSQWFQWPHFLTLGGNASSMQPYTEEKEPK